MGEVLNNGVYLPDRGERNAYDGLKGNWNILDSIAGKVPGYDGHISDTDIHVTAADKQTWNGKADASHVHNANDVTTGVFDAARIPNLDASKITTGTIDIDRLPQGALERLVKVADQAARYALTAADVQLGDTVQQLDTGVMYVVTDETKLDSADGYTEYTAGSATSVPWSGVTGKPADYTPASHSHGNITNDGKVGTAANKPLITGTGGVVQAGSFGNQANTFCEGNDSRLSNARTPVAHTHTKSDVTDLLNSNFIPSANNSYNLGSSEYNWNNVYCNAIYSPAIINSNNAASPSDSLVSSIVALRSVITYTSGDPDATARLNFRLMGTGEKSFYPHESNQYSFGLASRQWSNSYIQHGYFTGIQQNDEYSNNVRTNLTLTTNRDSPGVSGILVDSFRSNTTQGQAHHILGFEMKENSVRYSGCRMHWSYDNRADNYNFALCPTKQGTNQPASFGLGEAGFYWDTINDINPGALSLPVTALDNTYDISGNITDLTGGNNAITAARTGWIFVKSDNATEISVENTITGMGASDHSASATTLMVSIPVTSGETLNIIANCISIDKAYLLPCQGNV